MNWIFIAVSAHFFWALVNIGDKYIVGHRVKNPYVYLVWLTMFGIISIVFIPFIDFIIPDARTMIFLVIGSLFYFFGGLPYIRAMQLEEPTRINIWWNLIPLFGLLLGFLFFDERLTYTQIIAFVLLMLGAFVASFHARGRTVRFSKAFVLMIIATFSFAIYGVAFNQAAKEVSFLVGFVWVHLIMFFATFTLFISKKFRTGFRYELSKVNKKTAYVIVGISLVDHLGILMNQWALTYASAALVYAFEGSQVIFVFVIATIISLFFPHVVKEDLDKRNVLLKLAAITLMILGAVILSSA